jgi:hypothetical protein
MGIDTTWVDCAVVGSRLRTQMRNIFAHRSTAEPFYSNKTSTGLNFRR